MWLCYDPCLFFSAQTSILVQQKFQWDLGVCVCVCSVFLSQVLSQKVVVHSDPWLDCLAQIVKLNKTVIWFDLLILISSLKIVDKLKCVFLQATLCKVCARICESYIIPESVILSFNILRAISQWLQCHISDVWLCVFTFFSYLFPPGVLKCPGYTQHQGTELLVLS